MSNFDGTGFNLNNNFTWWNTTATNANFTFTTDGTASNWQPIIPDKDWMPNSSYVEYEPLWHKKFASYKNQMEKMWD